MHSMYTNTKQQTHCVLLYNYIYSQRVFLVMKSYAILKKNPKALTLFNILLWLQVLPSF